MKVSWSTVEHLVTKIESAVDESKFQNIYGVPRGGLVPAVMLSHKLKLPIITNPDHINESTLIVDEICDSGDTFQSLPMQCKKVALYSKEHSEHLTDYSAATAPDNWVVFPWED